VPRKPRRVPLLYAEQDYSSDLNYDKKGRKGEEGEEEKSGNNLARNSVSYMVKKTCKAQLSETHTKTAGSHFKFYETLGSSEHCFKKSQ
jgi:hypothetical protein